MAEVFDHFTSGDRVVRRHPHPAFDKVIAGGYSLWYCFRPPIEQGRRLFVQVRMGAEVITCVEFACGLAPFCQNIEVPEALRRRGLANAIYVFAEKRLGRTLCNFWRGMKTDDGKSSQSPLAQALWAQPNRPFGPQAK